MSLVGVVRWSEPIGVVIKAAERGLASKGQIMEPVEAFVGADSAA